MLKIFRKRYSNELGFTLIEVLIAILILSFISLYASKMIDENITTKEKVTSEDKDLMQTLTALNRIEADFNEFYSPLFTSSIMPPTASNNPYEDSNDNLMNSNFQGKTKNGFSIPNVSSDDKSSFVFLSLSNRRKIAETKESNFMWIKYSLKRTEDEEESKFGGHDLIRQTISTDPFNPSINWSDVKEQVILSNIKTLEFHFYDDRNKKYVTSLSDLNENKNSLRSIKVLFTWVNKDKNEFKFEKIFRVLIPYFNTKQDDLKSTNNGAWDGQAVPPGIPDPNNPNNGGSDVNF